MVQLGLFSHYILPLTLTSWYNVYRCVQNDCLRYGWVFLKDKATQSNIFALWIVCPNFKSTHIIDQWYFKVEKKLQKLNDAIVFI